MNILSYFDLPNDFFHFSMHEDPMMTVSENFLLCYYCLITLISIQVTINNC